MVVDIYKLFKFIVGCFLFINVHAQSKNHDDRKLWLNYMDKIARPVLSNLAEGGLKEKMQVVLSKNIDNKVNRIKASYLKAFGRWGKPVDMMLSPHQKRLEIE